MSSNAPPSQPTQSPHDHAAEVQTEEEAFQALFEKRLASVLLKLSELELTDLKSHANERVIRDLTKKATKKEKEYGELVPVARRMTPKDRKDLAHTLVYELDNFLEGQVLYEPEDITSVPSKESTASQAAVNSPFNTQGGLMINQEDQIGQHITVGEACRRLGIRQDPVSGLPILDLGENSGLQPFTMHPWHATGVLWMLSQESEPIRGGIVADARGMGQMLMALTLIFLEARRRAQEPNAVFRPNLMVVPTQVFINWFDQIRRLFGNSITLHLFYGWKENLPRRTKGHFVPRLDLKVLERAVTSLAPKDPRTARTRFLTTYETWRIRFRLARALRPVDKTGRRRFARHVAALFQDNDSEDNAPEDASESERAGDSDDDDESEDESLENQSKKRTTKTKEDLERKRYEKIFRNVCKIHWGRIICDEGSLLKSTGAQRHQAIAQLTRDTMWLLDPAPIRNHISDILGYLSILSRGIPELTKSWKGHYILPSLPDRKYYVEEGFESTIDCYRQWSGLCGLRPEDRPWSLFSRTVLESIIGKGPVRPDIGFDTLAIINRLSQLQRNIGDVIHDDDGKLYQVGEKTPPLRVMTIELRYSSETQTYHNEIYECMTKDLSKTGIPETEDTALDGEEDGLQDSKKHRGRRRLSLLAFSPLLDKFIRRLSAMKKLSDELKWYLSGRDIGFGMFWAATRDEDSQERIPATRAAQATYLAKDCPRLRYLVRIMDSMGAFEVPATGLTPKEHPRFLVICHWPLSAWLVEMFLSAMGILYKRILPGMTFNERAAIVGSFRSSDSKNTVLLTTYSCGFLGLADHLVFSNLVLMPDKHLNSQFQTINRIHRLGQSQPQRVWMLFMEHTINRYIDYKNIEKILPQIAGEQHDNFAIKLGELRQGRSSDLGLGSAASAPSSAAALEFQRQKDIQILAYEYLCRSDKLGIDPGCAERDSRFGRLHDLDTEDVEDPLHQKSFARSRRTPINAVTRAKEIEEELKNSRKRKLEEDFSDDDPALKHMKLKRNLQE